MKKILKTLLMLTFVFALTACGSEEALSDIQQDKVTMAESKASAVVELVSDMLDANSDSVNELLDEFNNIELGNWFTIYMRQYGDNTFLCEGKAVNGAFTSFQSGKEEIGSITEFGDPSSKIDDDSIVVTIPIKGEQGNGSIEVIFDNDIYMMTMVSCTLNVDKSLGQLMARAGMNTLLGMGTVFIVLILISLIISCFSFIPKIQASFASKKAVDTAAPEVPAAPVEPVVVEDDDELSDDMELVAVIAAAVAAYEGTNVEGFQVRSIKRAATNKWKRA